LDYNGNALFSNSVTANSFVKVGGTNTQFLMADGSTTNLGSMMSGSGTSGYLSKWTSATSQGNSIIYDNGANVGIGTETPDNAQGWNRVLNLHGTNHAKFLVTESSGVKVGIFSHTGYNGKIGTESNHNLTFTAGYWNDVMTLTTAGNVGIGTLNPSGQFEAYTDGYKRFAVSYPSAFETKLSIGANAFINQHANNEELSISQQYGAGKITFYTGYPNTEKMRITSTGNVGIGSTNPQANLSIKSGSNVDAEINSLPDGISIQSFNRTSSAYGDISFLTNASGPSLLINNEGQVCIGCTTRKPAAYKLAVEGGIAARSLRITQANPWADYVFDKKYQLKPLDEVEKYIQQNHHLPDMPSAATVAAEGIDVAEIQSKLLSKIEELTLYVIELKKEVDALKKNQPKKTKTNK
jgi:hypothetical protein